MKILAKAIAVILTFYSATANARVPDWSVSELNGSVTVVRAQGTSVAANRGTILRPGDSIYTAAKSRAVIVRKQEFVILAENSRIVAAPPKAGSMVQIVQKGGNAVYKIKKKATPHFSVQTPYLAAVVKGTTFSVTVTASGTSVQVMEGRVQVIANEGSADHLLTPGKIGAVDSKSPNRLTVKGDGPDIVIEGAAVGAGTASAIPVASVTEAPVEQTRIAADVTEGAIRLEDVTDGLITGDSSLRALVRLAKLDDSDRPAVGGQTPGPGKPAGDDGPGNGNGGSGDKGSGKDGDNDKNGKGGDDDKGGKGGDDDKNGKDGDDDKGGKGGDDDKGSKDRDDDKSGKGGDDDKGGKGGDDDKGGKGGDDDKGGKDRDDDKGGKGGDDDKGGKGGDDDKGGKDGDD